MTQSQWAKNEVALACKRELADPDAKQDRREDYGCSCYASALRAYRCLMKDGHSGSSIVYTRNILMRLLTGRPLTPIEDTPDVWSNVSDISGVNGEEANYQCTRMSSLFKYVYADGTVKYKDVDSCFAVNVGNEKATYHSSLVQKIMDELWPIKMPYNPGKQTKFVCEEFLVDPKNGDYDTVGILRAQRPNGDWVDVNQYYKEVDHEWIRIGLAEYHERYDASLITASIRALNAMEKMPVEEQQEVAINDQGDKGVDPGATNAACPCGACGPLVLRSPDRESGCADLPGDVGEAA